MTTFANMKIQTATDERTGRQMWLAASPDLAKPRLSYSQLSLYLRCPRLYQYRYIMKRKQPPTPELALGSAWHAGQEANLSQKIVSGRNLPVEEVVDAFVDALRAGLAASGMESSGDWLEEIGIEMTRVYHAEVASQIEPVAVEQSFLVGLGADYPFTLYGLIDVIDTAGTIIDHKGYSPTSYAKAQKSIRTDHQLTTYALAYRAATGREESGLAFGVAVKGSPVTTDVIRTVRTRGDIDWFLGMVEQVGLGIQVGVFPPNADTWACSPRWCPEWQSCMGHRVGI